MRTAKIRALTECELDLATGGLSLLPVKGIIRDILDSIKTPPTFPVPPKEPIVA